MIILKIYFMLIRNKDKKYSVNDSVTNLNI